MSFMNIDQKNTYENKINKLSKSELSDHLKEVDPYRVFSEYYKKITKMVHELEALPLLVDCDDYSATMEVLLDIKENNESTNYVSCLRKFESQIISPSFLFSLRKLIQVELAIKDRAYLSVRGIEDGRFPMINNQVGLEPTVIVKSIALMGVIIEVLDLMKMKGVDFYRFLELSSVRGLDYYRTGGDDMKVIRGFWLPN